MVEDFSFESPKTQEFINILVSLGAIKGKSLLVTSDYEREVLLSSRNIKESKVTLPTELNTYELLNSNTVILSEGSIEKIKESFA